MQERASCRRVRPKHSPGGSPRGGESRAPVLMSFTLPPRWRLRGPRARSRRPPRPSAVQLRAPCLFMGPKASRPPERSRHRHLLVHLLRRACRRQSVPVSAREASLRRHCQARRFQVLQSAQPACPRRRSRKRRHRRPARPCPRRPQFGPLPYETRRCAKLLKRSRSARGPAPARNDRYRAGLRRAVWEDRCRPNPDRRAPARLTNRAGRWPAPC